MATGAPARSRSRGVASRTVLRMRGALQSPGSVGLPTQPPPGSAVLHHVTLYFSARGHRMSVPFALPVLSFPLNVSRFKLLSKGRTHLRALLAPRADGSEFLPPWRRFQLCFYLKLHVSTKHIALKGPLACAASSAAISSTMMWWILAVKALVLREEKISVGV